ADLTGDKCRCHVEKCLHLTNRRHGMSQKSSEKNSPDTFSDQPGFVLNEPTLQWLVAGWPSTEPLPPTSTTTKSGVANGRARSSVYCKAARHRHVKPAKYSPFDQLSQREKEVFRYIALGKSNKYIAQELGVSQRTIEAHRARVF